MPSPIVKMVQVKSIITKSSLPASDYAANPYIGCTHNCQYCYASYMKRFTGHDEPWGSFLDVKYWPEVKNVAKYADKEIFLSSVTDPYLPQEKLYERTKTLLMQLKDSSARIVITTKSDLVLRDLELIKSFPKALVAWSINTLDSEFQRDMDCGVSIERRLAAMKTFHEAGVRTACFISPIFPGITDVRAIINASKSICNFIWLENLNLRGNFRKVILDYVLTKHKDLWPLYREIFCFNNKRYWQILSKKIHEYANSIGLEYVVNQKLINKEFSSPPTIVNYFYHELIKRT